MTTYTVSVLADSKSWLDMFTGLMEMELPPAIRLLESDGRERETRINVESEPVPRARTMPYWAGGLARAE